MNLNFDFIETDRLRLRIITQEVFNTIFQEYSEQEQRELLGTRTDLAYAKEREKFEKGLSTYNRTFLLFQLIDKSSDRVIGGCGYHNWLAEHRRSEIGYALLEDEFMNKGFMTEAFKPILHYGFTSLNLNRIEACVNPHNEASLSIMKKFDFKQEGHLREHFIKNDEIQDSLIFSRLKRDYDDSLKL